jgi:HPt (histidine-containing phosphotransfer) domain-containing protein
MDDYLAKPFSREALHITLAKWLVQVNPDASQSPLSDEESTQEVAVRAAMDEGSSASMAVTIAPGASESNELLLDPATLNALRALPRSGPKDMLSHIAEIYLSDSSQLVDSIEQALHVGEATSLARAAHAWRSYNGNVGALSLARLCRELENSARAGNLAGAREIFGQIQVLHGRVRDELQYEMRRSA